MLAEWVLCNHRQRRQQQQQGGQQEKLAVLSSTVSSRMLAAIAEQEGIYWAETLTGARCWLQAAANAQLALQLAPAAMRRCSPAHHGPAEMATQLLRFSP